MKVPLSLVLILALIASGCASLHDPVAGGSESEVNTPSVAETGMQDVETSETNTNKSAETLEWAQAPSVSNALFSNFYGLLFVGWAIGLYALWKLVFD